MSLTRFFYDPSTEFESLFDDAFNTRFFRPRSSWTDVGTRDVSSRTMDVFKPRHVSTSLCGRGLWLTWFSAYRLDLQENVDENAVTARIELPGMKPEDIRVDVQNDRLTVSGETSATTARDEGNYLVRERSYGKFSRTLVLPPGTKPEDIKANLDSGVLTITFPKAPPDQAPKRITIT
ncbi:small heat shock protein [Pisolithus marmoratus]|nr:small heat shock protein [Pisolithus marmoratus]